VAASLGAAASFGLSGTFVRRHLADIPPIHLAAGQLGMGAVLLAVPAAASMPPVLPSADAIGAALALAVVSTSVAWPVYYGLLARTGPTAASTVTFLVPVSAAIWGATVLGEHVGPELLPGVALIVASLALVLGIRPTIGRPLVRRLLLRPTGG
jgi:drug/metabolite transporter (DMT)-like permease